MGKGLWHICMCHQTEHGKVDFPKFPPSTQPGGYIPQLLFLNSEIKLKIFPMSGGGGFIQQLFMLNSEMKDLHSYLLWGFLQY